MRNAESMGMDPDELDDLDRAILDILKEGRGGDDPWGIATPNVVREELLDRGYDGLPVRQTINKRMRNLQHADHLKNLHGQGVYKFLSDPREQDENREDQ